MNDTVFFRPSQLRQRWGFNVESIRRMMRQGRLPAMRIGGRLLIAEADVLAFESSHRTTAQQKGASHAPRS